MTSVKLPTQTKQFLNCDFCFLWRFWRKTLNKIHVSYIIAPRGNIHFCFSKWFYRKTQVKTLQKSFVYSPWVIISPYLHFSSHLHPICGGDKGRGRGGIYSMGYTRSITVGRDEICLRYSMAKTNEDSISDGNHNRHVCWQSSNIYLSKKVIKKDIDQYSKRLPY